MDQGIRGMDLFWAGWMTALVAFYLGGLNTGPWLPLIVASVGGLALILMIVGLRQFPSTHRSFRVAERIAIAALIIRLCYVAILAISMVGITNWMSAAALMLALASDVLFMILTGIVFLGSRTWALQNGDEKATGGFRAVWALFLAFAILYVAAQTVSILFVNEGIAALTYGVPVAGIPVLVIGIVLVVRIGRAHPTPAPE